MTGIFAIESRWEQSSEPSAKPMLDVVTRSHNAKLVHRVARTRRKFLDHLRSWDECDSEFCFVHLWFHGFGGGISVDGDDESSSIRLHDILDAHYEHPYNWKNCVLHFGACSTMATHSSDLREFLDKTELSAISGYEDDVDWIEPLAFESMYLHFLLEGLGMSGRATPDKMRVCRDKLTNSKFTAGISRALKFKMVIAGD